MTHLNPFLIDVLSKFLRNLKRCQISVSHCVPSWLCLFSFAVVIFKYWVNYLRVAMSMTVAVSPYNSYKHMSEINEVNGLNENENVVLRLRKIHLA